MSDSNNKIPNCDVPALWFEHKTALKGYIHKRVADEDLVNDILQEVLLKVYKFCLSKSGVRNIRSWLFQITQNTITDHYRKNSHFTPLTESDDQFEDGDNTSFSEAAEFILPMINLLPGEYSLPLKLSDVDGMKQQEIAERLQLGLSATKSRIQRARAMLKDIFAECCIMEMNSAGQLISFDIRPDCKPLQKYKAALHK
jgi:RNA polymerase sigma-70 factor, ECF subfamily